MNIGQVEILPLVENMRGNDFLHKKKKNRYLPESQNKFNVEMFFNTILLK